MLETRRASDTRLPEGGSQERRGVASRHRVDTTSACSQLAAGKIKSQRQGENSRRPQDRQTAGMRCSRDVV